MNGQLPAQRLGQRGTHIDDGVLAFDTRSKLELLDFNHEIARLHVAGNGKGDIELADGLRPLVRQAGLLFKLLGARGGVFSR